MKWLDESLMQLVTFGKLVRKYIERKRILDTTSVMQTIFFTYLMKESNCPCDSIFITRMKSFDKQWNSTGSISRHLKQKLTNFFATKYEFNRDKYTFNINFQYLTQYSIFNDVTFNINSIKPRRLKKYQIT